MEYSYSVLALFILYFLCFVTHYICCDSHISIYVCFFFFHSLETARWCPFLVVFADDAVKILKNSIVLDWKLVKATIYFQSLDGAKMSGVRSTSLEESTTVGTVATPASLARLGLLQVARGLGRLWFVQP